MLDQATELRKLALRVAIEGEPASAARPRLVIVSGGKGGVGVTTLAVNLAVGFAARGRRTLLVDTDLYRAGVAALCGIRQRGSVADVLTGRRTLAEVVQRGPAGIHVLPGAWAPRTPAEFNETAQRRLLRQLTRLGDSTDVAVLDAGSNASDVARRFWQAADDVVLVTTPDGTAIIDCYATIKQLATPDPPRLLRLVVNQTSTAALAEEVRRRIHVSCQRFLRLPIDYLGHVPADNHMAGAVENGNPLLAHRPESPAACAIARLVDRLTTDLTDKTCMQTREEPVAREPRIKTKFVEPQTPCGPISSQSTAVLREVNLENLREL